MAKSLFRKGADFVSSMVFMFASTNLVVELGIVLLVLMGWQFTAAEFVGGPIMIVLLAVSGGFVLRGTLVERARTRLRDDGDGTDAGRAEIEQISWGRKLTSKAAWSDAAGYTMADIKMLRRELVIGYGVAGFLTVLVPMHVWNAVFLHGHGFWTTAENVVVGPLIAFVSFVCSIGNVPMAAALWHGGISFGGVISFIFADLITLPLVLVYRKYYGTRLTIRLVAWFYAVMVIASLVVEGLFRLVGGVPTRARRRSSPRTSNGTTRRSSTLVPRVLPGCTGSSAPGAFGGDTVRDRSDVLDAGREGQRPGASRIDGHDVWFCSDRCRGTGTSANLRALREREILGRDGPAHEIALDVPATEVAERGQLGLGLDPFRDHLDAERGRHADHRVDDRSRTVREVGHEAAVDLQAVELVVAEE